jgi:hypothetical protein
MKRNITLTAMFAVSLVLVSLASSDSSIQAQQRGRLFHWDTGVVKLGPNQVLRVAGDANGDADIDSTDLAFRESKYGQGACNGSVCKLNTLSTTERGPFRLSAGEAMSLELGATTFGRVIVTSSRRHVRVTASIMNTTTGETTSHIIMANTEGDFH